MNVSTTTPLLVPKLPTLPLLHQRISTLIQPTIRCNWKQLKEQMQCTLLITVIIQVQTFNLTVDIHRSPILKSRENSLQITARLLPLLLCLLSLLIWELLPTAILLQSIQINTTMVEVTVNTLNLLITTLINNSIINNLNNNSCIK